MVLAVEQRLAELLEQVHAAGELDRRVEPVQEADVQGDARIGAPELLDQHGVGDGAVHDATGAAQLLGEDGHRPAEVVDGLHGLGDGHVRERLVVPEATVEIAAQRHDDLVHDVVEPVDDVVDLFSGLGKIHLAELLAHVEVGMIVRHV